VYPNGSGGGDEGGKKKEGPCLKVPATETPVIWELSFDLQSDSFMGGRKDTDRRNTRANTLMPSFRTPNIQLEVGPFFALHSFDYSRVLMCCIQVHNKCNDISRQPRRIFRHLFPDSTIDWRFSGSSFVL
jgi:hypothetical protein